MGTEPNCLGLGLSVGPVETLPTRLHSSRMRTARLLPISPSMHWSQGGVCSGRGCLPLVPGGLLRGGACLWSQRVYPSMQWGRPPPVNRILDTRFWKYYLAPTSLWAVKMIFKPNLLCLSTGISLGIGDGQCKWAVSGYSCNQIFQHSCNDFDAKKSTRETRVLVVTELAVSGTQCTSHLTVVGWWISHLNNILKI